MAKFLGVDTGGTFTDFILFDDESNAIRIHKVLSTPRSPEKAILQGIADLGLRDPDREANTLALVHGSTVATNAVLEGKGVRTAYITNKGMADVLAIGRQAREELYNLTPVKKPPLVPPELCLEVDSRLAANGEHLQQLTEQDLAELTAQLQTLAPKAVAINLLFSFFDDSEELKIENAIADHFGGSSKTSIFISRSSDVLPEYKEFERGMTTTLNAMVGPLMQGYLGRLQEKLAGCSLAIMQSSGGVTSAEQAGRYPVNLLLSGPAGGLKGAQTVALASGEDRLLSFDMGGTSTDVSIIDREIGFTTGAKIGGHPVAVPMVDMHTIGAGGGSIAQVDAGGLLLVGPQSAGADPGPACYGKGGERATVTDANVVLGRLLPQSFLGGNMQLDKAAATAAVNTIAEPLGLTVEQAAQGIIDVVNDHMVRALRVMSVERGEDPKDFTLVSFGGAGGLHVCALAEELEMTKALVPVNAGVLSALGMLAAEASRERSRTINKRLKDCDAESLDEIFEELVEHAEAELNLNDNAVKKENVIAANKAIKKENVIAKKETVKKETVIARHEAISGSGSEAGGLPRSARNDGKYLRNDDKHLSNDGSKTEFNPDFNTVKKETDIATNKAVKKENVIAKKETVKKETVKKETVIASEARQSPEATRLSAGDCFVPRNDGKYARNDEIKPRNDGMDLHNDGINPRNVSTKTTFSNDNVQIIQTVDVRYQGQSHALNLPWSGLENIEQAFHQKHKDSYGHDLDVDIELVNVRVRAIEKRQPFVLPAWQVVVEPGETSDQQTTTMPGITAPVPVINRAGLHVGQQITGPALIAETSSTTWLAAGWHADVDIAGNLKLGRI